jgi:hypothetical protein
MTRLLLLLVVPMGALVKVGWTSILLLMMSVRAAEDAAPCMDVDERDDAGRNPYTVVMAVLMARDNTMLIPSSGRELQGSCCRARQQ